MPGPKIIPSKIVSADSEETPIQKANRLGVPLIPKKPNIPRDKDPNPVIGVCGECGHELRKVEWRSCPLGNCPMGGTVTLN